MTISVVVILLHQALAVQFFHLLSDLKYLLSSLMAQQQRMQGAAIQAAREDAQREAAAKRIADIQSQQKGGARYGAV